MFTQEINYFRAQSNSHPTSWWSLSICAELAPAFSGFTPSLTLKSWASNWTRVTLTKLYLSEDQFAVFPEDPELVLFLAPVVSSNQQILPFPDQLAQRATRGMKGRLGGVWIEPVFVYVCGETGDTASGLERDIVCLCIQPKGLRPAA